MSYFRQRTPAFLLLAVTCAAVFWPRFAQASDLEQQLKTKYQNQVLTLRHFYDGNKLHFDSSGHLVGDATVGPWTLDGQIEVTEVHLHGQKLDLRGKRLRLIADPASHQLKNAVGLAADSPLNKQFSRFGGKEKRKFEKDAEVEIALDLPSVPKDESEVTAEISRVFLFLHEDLTEGVPEYWKSFLQKPETNPPTAAPAHDAYKVGGGVSAPHAISAPDPEYSEVAREVGFQGTLVLGLIITAEGSPRDIKIARPLGLGLDEKAVEAVGSWRFEPARRNGSPVPVEVNVEVSFHLY